MSKTAKTTQVQETTELADFTWDNSEKFFDIEPVETEETKTDFEDDDADSKDKASEKTAEETETETETETEEEKEKSTKVKKAAKTEEEPAPFSETKTETETEKNEEPDEDEEVTFYTTLAAELKEKNIFQTVEIAKDARITEEQFFELHDTEIENRVGETIDAFIEEMNEDDGAAFLKYKKAGGKTKDFFAVYRQAAEVPEVDLTKEEDQDKLLRYYYRNVDVLDDDDIDDKLEWLKETGKTAKYAEKCNSEIVKLNEAAKARLQSDAAAVQQKREDNKKLFINDVKKTLEATEQVGAFTLTKTDKKELADYIVKPTVPLGKGQYTTKLQADLNAIFTGDRAKLLLLAKLLKNDFDVSDIVKGVKTEVTKQTKSMLQSQKSGLRPGASATSKNRSLSDYF